MSAITKQKSRRNPAFLFTALCDSCRSQVIPLDSHLPFNTKGTSMQGISKRIWPMFALCLLATSTARADFNQALKAFERRDGNVMLAEVRSSVEKKDDNGLLVFLNALAIDQSATQCTAIRERINEQIVQSEKTPIFETILSEQQQSEFNRLINTAVHNSSADAQLRLLFLPKLTDRQNKKVDWIEEFEKLANQGSYFAAAQLAQSYSYPDHTFSKEKAAHWFIKAAELGDPEYAFGLATKYLHYPTPHWMSHEQCASEYGPNRVCFERDVDKGFLWLGKAAQLIDQHPELIRRFAYEMGNIYLTKFDTHSPDTHQAYLWYLLGIKSPQPANTGPDDKAFIATFAKMHHAGELKKVAPELDAIWKDDKKRDEFLLVKDMPQVPEFLAVARRKKLAAMPVFSFHANTPIPYYIDVYTTGTVKLQLNNLAHEVSRDTYLQLTPQKIQEFLKQLDSIGLDHWRLNNPVDPINNYICGESPCGTNDYFINLYRGIERRSMYFGEVSRDSKMDPENRIYLTEVLALIEEYFPIRELRCDPHKSALVRTEK